MAHHVTIMSMISMPSTSRHIPGWDYCHLTMNCCRYNRELRRRQHVTKAELSTSSGATRRGTWGDIVIMTMGSGSRKQRKESCGGREYGRSIHHHHRRRQRRQLEEVVVVRLLLLLLPTFIQVVALVGVGVDLNLVNYRPLLT